MKEADIRPDSLMNENQRLLMEDIKKLMVHKHDFVEIPCPACESKNYKLVFEKGGFTFVSCKECETFFINPRPPFSILSEFYETSECIGHWKKIFSETEDSRKNQIFIPRVKMIVELCKKYNAPTNVLLDVGAGFGTFCEEIKKKDMFRKVIAVEPARDLAEVCRKRGLDVIEKPIEKIDLDEISVVTSFELIEHLFWPKDYVLACTKSLSKAGLLILTTPNIKGFDLLTLGKLSSNIAGPNHLNYFHPKSLSTLLQKCGLEIIEVLTPGKLDAELVRKKILTKEFDVTNQPFLQHVLIEQWELIGHAFQKFLSENTLSSHLWIVAKKK